MEIAVLHETTDAEVEVNGAPREEAFSKDRRVEARLSAEDASWLHGARLKYGSDVRVVEVSELSQLKAIFFVREFAGDPNRVDSTDFVRGQHGRKVEVTFEDGEVLRGTTLACRKDGSGFFVQPADPASNNMRVFVSPGATRHVRFL